MIEYLILFILCVVAISFLIMLVHVVDKHKIINVTDRHMLKINKDHDKY